MAFLTVWLPYIESCLLPSHLLSIAFASVDNCITGATDVIVLRGACTATNADAADRSVCSRRSSVQCFFDSVELAELSPLISGSEGRRAATDLVQSGSAGKLVAPVSGSR